MVNFNSNAVLSLKPANPVTPVFSLPSDVTAETIAKAVLKKFPSHFFNEGPIKFSVSKNADNIYVVAAESKNDGTSFYSVSSDLKTVSIGAKPKDSFHLALNDLNRYFSDPSKARAETIKEFESGYRSYKTTKTYKPSDAEVTAAAQKLADEAIASSNEDNFKLTRDIRSFVDGKKYTKGNDSFNSENLMRYRARVEELFSDVGIYEYSGRPVKKK